MFAIKLFTGTARGASILASNQVNAAVSKVSDSAPLPGTDMKIKYKTITTAATSGGYLAQAAAKTNLMDQDVILPTKPKRPITPWLAFVRDRKDDILRQKDKMTAAELTVILSREWKYIDKTRYEQVYSQQVQEYQRKLTDYEQSLTKEHKRHIKLQKEEKRQARADKLLKKTNPPVLPRNPANLFCHERSKDADIKELLKSKKSSEVFKDIFREYRSLSDMEKKRYINMQADDKSRFQNEFLAWYEGIQKDETLTKAALDKADALRDRYKSLKYI